MCVLGEINPPCPQSIEMKHTTDSKYCFWLLHLRPIHQALLRVIIMALYFLGGGTMGGDGPTIQVCTSLVSWSGHPFPMWLGWVKYGIFTKTDAKPEWWFQNIQNWRLFLWDDSWPKSEDFKCKCFCWHWLCCIDIIVSYCIHLFTCRNSNGNKIWADLGSLRHYPATILARTAVDDKRTETVAGFNVLLHAVV